MPTISTTVECQVPKSFRVEQIAGMFDLPPLEKSRETFSVEVPSLQEDWTIGAIVGPSGSGKSTMAAAAFGDHLYDHPPWPVDRAVIDGFECDSVKSITQTLTAVGFSSPPSWIKPYHVLSNGERFRCDLARALLSNSELVVFDEFTSVVDRTVAKIGSAAVAAAIRKGRIARRFVAVTCHYDVIDWLEPDWVVDMSYRGLKRGRLRRCGQDLQANRPSITLEVVGCRNAAWRAFARHHYLSGDLSPFAKCYLALWEGEPVAFCAVLHHYGAKSRRDRQCGIRGRKRISRVVTLPDYQGMGMGARLVDAVCRHEQAAGHRMSITASHPAVIGYCTRSPHWKAVRVSKVGRTRHRRVAGKQVKTSQGRMVASFEYVGGAR